MSLPKISIITISFNSYKTIESTILSVLNQTYENKELIVIDGQSKDGTEKIIKKYDDKIAYWVSETDKGIPDALNKGIRQAQGEWVYFLSSDDVFYHNKVLENISVHLSGQCGLVYGNVLLKSKGKLFDGEYDTQKIIIKNICHQAQFYHRTVFEKVGDFNIQYKYLSDYDHTLRIFSDPNIERKYINDVIAIFNDEGRTSFSFDVEFWKDRKQNFIDRFNGLLSPEYAARGFEGFFYYTFQNGMFRQGINVMFQLMFYTGRLSYLTAGIRNWFSYLRKRSSGK